MKWLLPARVQDDVYWPVITLNESGYADELWRKAFQMPIEKCYLAFPANTRPGDFVR
ncbi:hypothetical protein IF690_15525 [Pseudomonas sp. SK3(2021)]|uniref:hypothetical protein n=1 Tax=Pseudomonas sp. SK3(2021) TaxID=2841064 RepID=UPI00192C0640|nr:hypothetical protein [Pseudomonas sp. SK3(2021)]QQZ39476.1 hypothetical protein IF690_15525 [Pseudomonas sp. SK3(2021)]